MFIQLVRAEILCHLLPLGRSCCGADSEGHNGNSLRMSMWRHFSPFRIATLPHGALYVLKTYCTQAWCGAVAPASSQAQHSCSLTSRDCSKSRDEEKQTSIFSRLSFFLLIWRSTINWPILRRLNSCLFHWKAQGCMNLYEKVSGIIQPLLLLQHTLYSASSALQILRGHRLNI